jgi:predicted nucleic acid-binding protein
MHRHNLLATDAVHVAAMRKENIIHLASNDTDFSRVDFLHLWRPEQDNSLF